MSLAFGLKSYSRVVTTAGVRVALSAVPLKAAQIAIRAKSANSGIIYVGGNDVDTNGYRLLTQDTLAYGDIVNQNADRQVDLTQIFIDASVSGEGVEVIYSAQFAVVD